MITSVLVIVLGMGFLFFGIGYWQEIPAMVAAGGILLMLIGAGIYDSKIQYVGGRTEEKIVGASSENVTITYTYDTPNDWLNDAVGNATFWMGFFAMINAIVSRRVKTDEEELSSI